MMCDYSLLRKFSIVSAYIDIKLIHVFGKHAHRHHRLPKWHISVKYGSRLIMICHCTRAAESNHFSCVTGNRFEHCYKYIYFCRFVALILFCLFYLLIHGYACNVWIYLCHCVLL